MKKTKVMVIAMALGCLMAGSSVQASITIDYTAASWGPQNFQIYPDELGDTLTLQAYSGSGLVLPDNTPVTAQIGTLDFNVNYSSEGSENPSAVLPFTASRLLTITAPVLGGQTISQTGTLNVGASADEVTIQSGSSVVYNYTGVGTITVTPIGLDTGLVGDLGDHYYNVEGNFVFTPVPEPTTIISGALLLLPFGASTLRILRRSRAA